MGQIVNAINGISEACKILSMPVVAGNVSLYNETEGKSIPPTPQIGAVGIIKNIANSINNKINDVNDKDIIIIGETKGHLECSLFAKEISNEEYGQPPEVNLEDELIKGKLILELISDNKIIACKDISDGGLAIALTELCVMNSVGCKIME